MTTAACPGKSAADGTSPLFAELERIQGTQPWGRILDAGTGVHSLRWLLGLNRESCTAITGASAMRRRTLDVVGGDLGDRDRVVVGNWRDPDLLRGERFDTVLADYLLGAIEGFAPYWQEQLFRRLRPHVVGRLYVIGVEPYVPTHPTDADGRLVNAIGRLRDACLLLAGDHPYREYPMTWCLEQLEQAGFAITSARRIPIRYGVRFVNGQLDMCVRRIARMAGSSLARGLADQVEALRQASLAHIADTGGLRHGHDYLIAAEPSA